MYTLLRTMIHAPLTIGTVAKTDGRRVPERKERILDATLEVIAEHGVYKTTHRRIAAQAEVPLGSVTYYFTDLTDVLSQAFTRLSERMSALYREQMATARTLAQAEAAVVDLICGSEYAPTDSMVLIFEMYAYANHNESVAALTRSWLQVSRESLALHFPPQTAQALDVLIEGWPMHAVFEQTSPDRDLVATTVHAIVTGLAESTP